MNFATLDRILQEAVPTVAPAVVCRVEQAGQLLYEGCYGWLNPMLKTQPVTPETLFDLASLTKLFTATACLRLHDAGKLALDQPLARWLPAFAGERPIGETEDPLEKVVQPPDPRWADKGPVDATTVTLRQLLTHTSGLPAWRSVYLACGPAPARGPAHRAEILRRQQAGLQALVQYPFAYPPGQSYLYSDIGLMLLGMALARCNDDVSLAETLAEWVMEPLGLQACFNPPVILWDQVAPTEYCPWRERRLRGEVHDENGAGLGGIAGHAGLFGTGADLCRLGRLYLAGGEGLLQPETVAESCRVQVEVDEPGTPLRTRLHAEPAAAIRRGLGWMLRSGAEPSCSLAFGPRSFGHTGFTGTSLWCDPDRELAVALLTNRVYHGRDPAAITRLRPAVHEAVIAALS